MKRHPGNRGRRSDGGVLFFATAALACFPSVSAARGQTVPAAAPSPSVPSPPSPVGAIRNKLSAGDLLSAESVLEVHREKKGEDGRWVVGLSWLARGTLLPGDTARATRCSTQLSASAADRMSHGALIEKDHDLETAYGGPSTPTFVIIDRSGIVPRYTPTRLTEKELSRMLDRLFDQAAGLHERSNIDLFREDTW